MGRGQALDTPVCVWKAAVVREKLGSGYDRNAFPLDPRLSIPSKVTNDLDRKTKSAAKLSHVDASGMIFGLSTYIIWPHRARRPVITFVSGAV